MFKSLKKDLFQYKGYSVLPYRKQDIFLIKEWRNAQIDVLRQKKLLSDEDQLNYYNNFVLPSFEEVHPKIMLFSFLENDKCIGYGGLTNMDWESGRVELSFLLDPTRIKDKQIYEADFSAFIMLMKLIVFDELAFNRIFTETYDIRPHHISVLEKNGFKLEGRLKEHVKINGKLVDSLIHGFIKEYVS